jgi:hypothetical protein
MDPVTGLVIGGIGMGASMLMDYSRRRKAERALARMGKRPQLSVPKEVMKAYQNRLAMSTKPQGYTNAEVNYAQNRIAAQNAGLQQKLLNAGGSAQAIQTALMNQNANANVAMAAQSAQLDRAGKASNLAAADQLAGQVGGYQTANERQEGIGYDNQVNYYGRSIAEANQGMSNALGTVAGLGLQGAMAGIGNANETTYDATKYKLVPIG